MVCQLQTETHFEGKQQLDDVLVLVLVLVMMMVGQGRTCGRIAADHGKLVVRRHWIAVSLR